MDALGGWLALVNRDKFSMVSRCSGTIAVVMEPPHAYAGGGILFGSKEKIYLTVI